MVEIHEMGSVTQSERFLDHTSEKEAVEETVQLSSNFIVEKDLGTQKVVWNLAIQMLTLQIQIRIFSAVQLYVMSKRTIRLKVEVRGI